MFHKISKQVGLIAIMLFSIFSLQSIRAEQNTNPNLTTEEVKELASYVVNPQTGKSPLSWKKEEQLGDQGSFWYQSVITAGGERITLAYWPSDEENPHFSFWWRKNGTTGRDDLYGGGINSDGTVNNGTSPDGKYCNFRTDAQVTPVRGIEHLAYCQTEINKRLRSALEYYRKK